MPVFTRDLEGTLKTALSIVGGSPLAISEWTTATAAVAAAAKLARGQRTLPRAFTP